MKEDIFQDVEKHTPWLSIFRTVAFIGDSLSSGELVSLDKDGNFQYNDYYDYSWGQFMARKYGFTAYNFSRGGMTAKEYLESFADRNRFFAPERAAQAYFIALGVNDIINSDIQIGTAKDTEDGKTFAGQLTEIIKRYKAIQPRAVFFLVTMPKNFEDTPEQRKKKEAHCNLLLGLAEKFENIYVIDLFRYAPEYDETFVRRHYMNYHLTPSGYLLTAEFIGRLADALIYENIESFREVGFIGTQLKGSR